MIVYEDRRDSFSSNHPTTSLTPTGSDSYPESLTSSWNSSINLQVGTPASSTTRRTSFDDTHKFEDLSLQNSTHSNSNLPIRFGDSSSNAFCTMSAMTQDMLSGFQDSNMFFGLDENKVLADTNTLNYNNFQTFTPATFGSFESECPSSDIPSLMEDLYSPTSNSETSGAMNFVDPTQTTFMENFADLQSSPIGPLTPIKFGTPSSDFNSQRSFNNTPSDSMSMGYLEPPYLEAPKMESSTPSKPSPLHQAIYQPPQSTAALQKIQQTTPSKPSRRNARAKSSVLVVPPCVRVQNKAQLQCHYRGCPRRFQRREHLKRHLPTHDPNYPKHPCPFCNKPFGRTDNLKSHIELHTKPDRKASRTKYYPEAAAELQEMNRKCRKNGERSEKSEKSEKTEKIKMEKRNKVLGRSRILKY